MKAFLERAAGAARRLRPRRVALVAASLAAAYLGIGFLLVPALVKWQLVQQLQERLGHRVTVGAAHFDPLRFTAELEHVDLRDPAGGALVTFRRLYVDFEATSLVRGAWRFREVALEGITLDIARDGNGRWNFARLIEALPAGEGPPPRLRVERVKIDALIDYSDHRLDAPLVSRIAPLVLEMTDLSTLAGASAAWRLRARSAAGETLRANGTLGLEPLRVQANVALQRLQLASLARALHEHGSLARAKGQIDLGGEFRIAGDERGGSALLEGLRIDASGLSVGAPGGDAPLVALENLSLENGRIDLAARAFSAGQLSVARGSAAFEVDEHGVANWKALLPPASREARPDSPPPEWQVALEAIEVDDVSLALRDRTAGLDLRAGSVSANGSTSARIGRDGVRLKLAGPRLAVSEFRVEQREARFALPQASLEGAALSVAAAGSRLEVSVEGARASAAGALAQHAGASLDLSGVTSQSARLALVLSGEDSGVELSAPQISAKRLALERGAERVSLHSAALHAKRVTLDHEGGALELASEGPRVSFSAAALRQGADAIEIKNGSLQSERASLRDAEGRSNAVLDGAGFALKELRVRDAGTGPDRARLATAQARAGSLALTFASSQFDAAAEGLLAQAKGLALRDPQGTAHIAELGAAELSGGSLRLGDRTLTAERLVLSGGLARVVTDARGRLNWAPLFPQTGAGGPPWRVAAKTLELQDLAAEFADLQTDPPFLLGLAGIRATLSGIDTGAEGAARLAASAAVRQGGRLSASGSLFPHSGDVDLEFRLDRLALAPAQPYLAAIARLSLASGSASASGRVRSGALARDAAILVEGTASVDDLRLEETRGAATFLALDSLAATGLTLALGPDRLEVTELRLARPSGRLIIAEDRSTNVSDVLRRAPGREESGQAADAEPPFPVSVARMRIEHGALEFADESVRPQFRARMHELKGVVAGLGTRPGSRATLELDARVDKYGVARVEGEIEPLAPRSFADAGVSVRNVELTSLAPYVSKFAGYRIAGGKLAMDLRYRIQDDRLVGENNIVLNKLELGEKVESPDALDLPLELGIALLKDSDGVIDIDIPVTGDLRDPKFDYGAVIGKAFGNLIGGIVTAPFRALGALFGGGSRSLDSIEFEPGSAVLAPPEREKLEVVARALRERPQLQLRIEPAFAPADDLAALRSVAVRRAVLERMGIDLAAGEAPGPLDLANPATRRGLEALVAERQPAGPPKPPAAGGEEAPAARERWYRAQLDRLIREHPLGEEALRTLARERGAAIVRELTGAGAVAPARVVLGDIAAAAQAGESAAARLALAALK